MRSSSPIKPVLSGKAVVCCVHDRQKRKVVTEAQIAALGLTVGQVFDPKQHKIHLCACCENLFVDPSDEPRYCSTCGHSLVHPLGGALREPVGVTDG